MLLAFLTFALSLAAGLAGLKLDPDTDLYASTAVTIHSPLASLINGHLALVAVSAIAAGATVYLVPRARRWWFAPLCLFWFLFPGVDALGAVFVALYARARGSGARAGWLGLAALAHPVAALTTWPALWRGRLAIAGAGVLAVAAIAFVGVLDVWATTDRYLLPVLTLAAVRWPR